MPKMSALKARFIARTVRLTRTIGARFQRLFTRRFEFLGQCPRLRCSGRRAACIVLEFAADTAASTDRGYFLFVRTS